MAVLDARGLPQTIRDLTYNAPSSYGGISLDDFRVFATMLWFSKARVLKDAANDFHQLWLYAWDGRFYCCVDVEALASRVWQRFIAVNDRNLSYLVAADAKWAHHVGGVAKRMLSLGAGPLCKDGVYVYLCLYRYFGNVRTSITSAL